MLSAGEQAPALTQFSCGPDEPMADHTPQSLPTLRSPPLSPAKTLLSPQELRALATWFRRFPHAKAQRAAELADLAASAQEKRGRR